MELVWFKNDLRIGDHEPLKKAIESGPILCLFILEPIVFEHPTQSARQSQFRLEAVAKLRESLRQWGGELLIMRGEALDVLKRVHAQSEFRRIWSHQETGTLATYERDTEVKRWLRHRGIEWVECLQHGVFRRLSNRDGWARMWHKEMMRPTCDPDLESAQWAWTPHFDEMAAHLPSTAPFTEIQSPLVTDPEVLLRSFLYVRGEQYQRAMSSPNEGWEACSRLSPFLSAGMLSMRQVFQETNHRQNELREAGRGNTAWKRSIASFGKRLRWHCHFIQKLESEPEIETRAMNPLLDGLRRGEHIDSHLQAWENGATGVPLVDACMRAVAETGWLNFRMRAMVVSYACYHLWLPWKLVADRLARYFVDFEPGIHYCQVQMQSGVTGINAVRMYNPYKQQKDQDPAGHFVRKWVPELVDQPLSELLNPQGVQPDLFSQRTAYPAPIVDLAEAGKRARQHIYSARKTPEAREASREVYIKHGSRRRRTESSRAPRKSNTSQKRRISSS